MGDHDPAESFRSAPTTSSFSSPLWFVLAGKVAENLPTIRGTTRVRNMLFLPCTYEQKFSAKQAISTLLRAHGRRAVGAARVFWHLGLGAATARFAAITPCSW